MRQAILIALAAGASSFEALGPVGAPHLKRAEFKRLMLAPGGLAELQLWESHAGLTKRKRFKVTEIAEMEEASVEMGPDRFVQLLDLLEVPEERRGDLDGLVLELADSYRKAGAEIQRLMQEVMAQRQKIACLEKEAAGAAAEKDSLISELRTLKDGAPSPSQKEGEATVEILNARTGEITVESRAAAAKAETSGAAAADDGPRLTLEPETDHEKGPEKAQPHASKPHRRH